MSRKIEAISHAVVALLSWLVPKKKGTKVFLSLQFEGRYGGNLKPVFEAFLSQSSGDVWWAARYQQTADELRSLGMPVVRSIPFWSAAALRAEEVWVDGVRSPLALGRFTFVQLWHGTGFKRIGIENKRRGLLGRILVRRFGRRTKFVSATSHEDSVRKQVSLCVSRSVITGSPRNDQLVRRATEMGRISKRYITYAPTYRDRGWSRQPLSDQCWTRINELAVRHDFHFVVKRHPSDNSLRVPDHLSRVRDITNEVEDVQELLACTSLLVSDYSGIVNDFVLLSRPVVWYLPDLSDYMSSNRDFYYPFPQVLPGPVVTNESDLFNLICDSGWFSDPSYVAKYDRYVSRYHEYRDDHSTSRVLALLT